MTDGNPDGPLDRRGLLAGFAGLLTLAGTVAPAARAAGDVEPLPAPADRRTTVLITGANRGLGLEFARQYARRDWRVIATCRDPDDAQQLQALAKGHPALLVEQLDVTDHRGVDALAARYRNYPIDLLLNNAGIGGGTENQLFGKLRYPVFDEVMAVNAVGPIKMAEAFLDHVRGSELRKIMTVSSSQGSIAEVQFPMLYWYRASKSAVNMLMVNLAQQLKRRGVIVGLVTPGATATDFIAPQFRKAIRNIREPLEATLDMVRNIDDFTLETTGRFVNYDGTTLPW
jgi:NAD(P)-dependent dehydrogenase (short-subunit alcohol dehydrogenase family)